MHQLKTYLSRLTIKNLHGEEIPKESHEHLCFFDFVDKFCSAKRRTVLYRGSNPEQIFQTKLFDIEGFSRILMTLGEKSHHFESNKYPLICIDDCSIEVFEFVFDRFHDKVCNLSFSNPKRETSRVVVSEQSGFILRKQIHRLITTSPMAITNRGLYQQYLN